MGKLIKEYFAGFGKVGLIVTAVIVGDVVGILQSYDTQLLIPTWGWWLILVIILIVSPFITFRSLRLELDKYRSRIRLKAQISDTSVECGGDDKIAELDITATIDIKIWTDVDIYTSSLVLNVVGVRDKKTWKFWKWFLPKTQRLFAIPISGQRNMIYDQHIRPDQQPFLDNVKFHWRGKRKPGFWYLGGWKLNQGSFYFELALETGSPSGTWRVIPELLLEERGLASPL